VPSATLGGFERRTGVLGRLMHSYRTTARAVLLLLLAAVIPATASARSQPRSGVPDTLVFPVVGEVSYENDFGDPRPQGHHEGNDIVAERRAPVVAVEAGKVKFWTTSAAAGCMLYLYGESGTTYIYIHLNNDVTDGNDNGGVCEPGMSYAPGLADGDEVTAGELIGYVGDSGDANGIHPHLHFEVHPHDGEAVSPYRHLRRAMPLLYAVAPPGARDEPPTLARYGTVESVDEDQLALSLTRVRCSDGASMNVEREVVVSVPVGAVVQRATGVGRRDVGLASREAGEEVVVWTQPLPETLRAQLGEPDEIAAATVLYTGD
jgi:hypothetical protein